jgi:hypothetical protein
MPPRTSESSGRRGRPRARALGACPLGCLLGLIVLGAGTYAGVRFAVPYVQAWRFEDAMRAQAEAAEVNSDEEIRVSLLRTAADLDLPLDPKELQVRRSREGIAISAAWTREVVLPKYRRVLHFQRSVTAPVGPQTP